MKYAELEEVFAGAGVEPAELVGFVTGWVSGAAAWDPAAEVMQDLLDLRLGPDQQSALVQLAETTHSGLADPEFGFRLTLLHEDAPLNERRQALSVWCQGFVAGFGSTGRFGARELAEEINELLEDFIKIASVDIELPDDEDNEADLIEITEYVRMGAMMVYAECGGKTVH